MALIVTPLEFMPELLRERGLVAADTPVHSSVIVPDDVKGEDVFGSLTLELASAANSITEIPLFLPTELEGKALTLQDLRFTAATAKKYYVFAEADAESFDRANIRACQAISQDRCVHIRTITRGWLHTS